MKKRVWRVEQVSVNDGGLFGKADELAVENALGALHMAGWTIVSVAAGCGHTSMRLITSYRDVELSPPTGGSGAPR